MAALLGSIVQTNCDNVSHFNKEQYCEFIESILHQKHIKGYTEY